MTWAADARYSGRAASGHSRAHGSANLMAWGSPIPGLVAGPRRPLVDQNGGSVGRF
jgi:hypothetical protein